jgi:hypothetical protein
MRKNHWIRIVLALLVTSLFGAAADRPNGPVLGVAPAALLALLPPAPSDWKLVSSKGFNEVSAYPALLTFATRAYQSVPPETGTAKAPVKKTELTLTDTAFDPDRAFAFDAFTAPSHPDTATRSTIEGCPLLEREIDATKRRVLIAFESRYILAAVFENQSEDEQKEWLKQLNVKAIAEAALNAPQLPPTPQVFLLAYVDEMNPTADHTSQRTYLTHEERKANAEREAAKLKQKSDN